MKKITDPKIQNHIDSLSTFQKPVVMQIREIVLATDDTIEESIKWGSIVFHRRKNICGFRLAKAHVTLLFMEGASLKTPNILEGNGSKARTYKVNDINKIDASALTALVQECLKAGM